MNDSKLRVYVFDKKVFMTDLIVKKRVGGLWLIYVVSLALTACKLKSLVFVSSQSVNLI